MSFIHAEKVCKTFVVRKKRPGKFIREKRTVSALNEVSFSMEKGEMIGYLGPNGAGKSTTVKILSGILVPDSGDVLVDGRVPWRERKQHARNIGVVFGQRTQLWWDVCPLDSYDLLKDIYELSNEQYQSRLDELKIQLSLEDILHIPLRQLSLGQRMRAEVAGSLLHSPSLLFLDEPSIGLDAPSKLKLREFLKQENAEHGTTIILTTHDTEDIGALCRRVCVIGHGNLLYDGSYAALLDTYDTEHVLSIRFSDPIDVNQLKIPLNCSVVSVQGEEIKIAFPRKQVKADELIALCKNTGEIREFTSSPKPVDDLISKMYADLELTT